MQHTGKTGFAGFSLGGLSAMDIVWNHSGLFNRAGIFSGSFWWRSLDQLDPAYDDNLHRIMHQQVRNGNYIPGMKFFFQCGNNDETRDRNKNGIIDSIDDTLDLVKELEKKGYTGGYLLYPENRRQARYSNMGFGDALVFAMGLGLGNGMLNSKCWILNRGKVLGINF